MWEVYSIKGVQIVFNFDKSKSESESESESKSKSKKRELNPRVFFLYVFELI